MRLVAIEEIDDEVSDESLVTAASVVFAVQYLHKKMMRVKIFQCNQFFNF